MDAVELNYPVDVAAAAATKLVGSEGVGRDRVVAGFGVENRARALSDAGEGSSVSALSSASWNNGPTIELCKKNNSQASNHRRVDLSKRLHSSETNGPSWLLKSEEVNRKAGRLAKGGGGCSKRPRISPLEDAAGLTGVDDTKDLVDKLGSCLTKCDSLEKTQFRRQRSSSSSRRGDRRNPKISPKAKYDPFSVKAGLPSFSSTGGASNFSALYGLKTDVHDIAKLVDNLSLNDLLSGTYQCRSLGKEKGKKAANSNECLLQSLRKACSVLQVPKPSLTQNVANIDSCLNETAGIFPESSLSLSVNGDTAETITADLSPSDKDSCSKPESSVQILNFQFDRPRNTLERLALAPSKDLESLLQDAVKPAASSRSTVPDPRPGKQLARHASLPPFPWSQNFNGHCRAYSDSAKLLTSRSTCQGRWARIDNGTRCMEAPSNSFTNLESLAYDEALVPSCGPNLESDDKTAASSMSACTCNHSLSATLTSPASQVSSESGGDMKCIAKVEHCPRLVAAAQTLVDIAAHGSRTLKNHEKTMKWPKQPSQKAMKARKLKSNEKHDLFIPSTSLVVASSDRMIRGIGTMDQVMPSKKLKLSTVESKKDLGHINGSTKRGPSMLWSTPKSSRSSPIKPLEDSVTEARYSAAYILKQSSSCMMPPPPKALGGRSCSSSSSSGQPKFRKLM